MGTSGGPYIVRDSSLILELDAADRNSYSGSGTIWNDLSGNNRSGSLVSGSIFNSDGGSIFLNGTSSYVSITSGSGLDLGVNFTIQTWCKPFKFGGLSGANFNRGSIITNSYPYTAGQGFYISLTSQSGSNSAPTPGSERFFISFGNDQQASTSALGSLTAFTGSWVNLAVTANGTSPIRLYINGTEANYLGGSPGNGPASISYSSGPCSIGNRNNSLEFFNGSFGPIQIYNRALSASEILQNYNEQKSRFSYNNTIIATGGTITDVDGYRYHTFTSSSNFVVSQGGTVEYLVVAGGGGGGNGRGGGGGAGGMKTGSNFEVTTQTYTVIIGAGGAAETQGGASSVFGVSTTGGGRGGTHLSSNNGGDGGSGGGAAMNYSSIYHTGGSGVSGEGSSGGNSGTTTDNPRNTGGGGGKSAAGTQGQSTTTRPNGGAGAEWPVGSGNYYAGGGGGARGGTDRSSAGAGTGGIGGGGTGGGDLTQTSGSANTGGGGGGSEGTGSPGGSGVVIIRYLI